VIFLDVHGGLDCVVVLNMLVDHDVAATMTRYSGWGPPTAVMHLKMAHLVSRVPNCFTLFFISV
jgi:hypothetical protein